jgi:hypothetical protein
MNLFCIVRGVLAATTLLALLWVPRARPVYSAGACAGPICISEIRIDQPGADLDEYFELTEVGGLEQDLSALTYLVIGDGSAAAGSGVIEAAISMAGFTVGPGQNLIVAETSFTLGPVDLFASLNFENGDNVTHLLVEDFSGTVGQDLDLDDDGALDLTPWLRVLDQVALIEQAPPLTTELAYGAVRIGPDGSLVPAHVWQCQSGWQIGQLDPASGLDTPGWLPEGCALTAGAPTAVQLTMFAAAVPAPQAMILQLGLIAGAFILLKVAKQRTDR